MLGGAYLCFAGAERVLPHKEPALAEKVAAVASAEHAKTTVSADRTGSTLTRCSPR
jgi:predicted DNA repair protein MutK